MYYIEPEENSPVDNELVKATLDKYLEYYQENRDFSVHFIDDEEIRELNNEYRNMDNPTDILTFRIEDGDDFPIVFDEEDEVEEVEEEMGDIFISLESMRRNAQEFGVEEGEELKRLLLHGLLQLRGLDHKTNDFKVEPMLMEQERVLAELGGVCPKN
ncbi:MAG: rRNA maturation RNase YbeY [Spirochaetales bacterium]|nr:rRNA maturation RNase YbeY [Candidatus Physcosoma equi]